MELSALCGRFGTVTCCVLVPNYENDEAFVETYHVQYERLQTARFAKRQLDGRSFFGGVLHVCYAPELETVKETRAKLVLRRKEIATRVKKKAKTNVINGSKSSTDSQDYSQKSLENSRLPVRLPQEVVNSTGQEIMDTASPQSGPGLNSTSQIPLGFQSQDQNLPTWQQGMTWQHLQPQSSVVSPQTLLKPGDLTTLKAPPSSSLPLGGSSKPVSGSTLRFIPRQVSIPKRIVYHKKS